MSYRDFTLTTVHSLLGLEIEERVNLFADVPAVAINPYLADYLSQAIPLAMAVSTEKARSELIVAPLLFEVRRIHDNQISLFSGVDLNVDPSRGLNGVCDFLISGDYHQTFVKSPLLVVVEAKNEQLKGGYSQCIATMFAAHLFNEQAQTPLDAIYGVVTTGNQWKFLKLQSHMAYIDVHDYYIEHVEKIVGILCTITKPIPVQNDFS